MTFQGNRWHNDMYIFSEVGNKPINAESGRIHLQRVLKKHNLPPAVFHGFRSVAQILWTQKGFKEVYINLQLDHSVISGSNVIERYMGEIAFIDERAEMIQYLANHIEHEVEKHQANLT